jgi:hypothetical protein
MVLGIVRFRREREVRHPMMSVTDAVSLKKIVLARQTVRKLTQELAFSRVDQTKMVTAASELARNALVYGGGGSLHWECLVDGSRMGCASLSPTRVRGLQTSNRQ